MARWARDQRGDPHRRANQLARYLKNFGLGDLVPQFDTILTSTSPHYKYAKSLSHGIAIMEVDGDKEVRVTFVQIADVKSPTWDGTAERVKFRTASGSNTVEIVS